MAPKVDVPMDFGLELLGSPSHGNLDLDLAPGLDPVKVNTAIMSYNSPVIYRHTTELHQNIIDVVEFSREAVQCFSRACYCGQLDELEMGLFRHLFKMAVVFEVAWLEARCLSLYKEFVERIVKEEYKFGDFLVFYKEAEYFRIHMKKGELLDIIITALKNEADKKNRFINDYITDIDVLSTKEVEVVCDFAGNKKDLLVESIIRCIDTDNSAISPNCNHILERIDFSSCLEGDSKLLDRLQQSIVSVDSVTKRDVATNMKMLKHVYEMQPQAQVNPVPNVTPSNLFHSFREICDFYSLDELILYVAYESKDPSLFTLIDGVHSWSLNNKDATNMPDRGSFIANIISIKGELGWDPLPYDYLKNIIRLRASFDPWFNNLLSSDIFIDSITTKKGYLSFHSESITSDILFSSPDEYSLTLKCDSDIDCPEGIENCGIIIKSKISKYLGTGTKHFRYDLHVCYDFNKHTSESDMYSHGHTAFLSPNVHLCLYRVKFKVKEYLPLSWYGKPDYDGDKDIWRWGAYYFCNRKDNGDLFSDQRVKYKQNWNLARHGKFQLAAFVKL